MSRIANFCCFGCQIISKFGNSVTNFALPVLVLAIIGSPARTGIGLVAQKLPYLVRGLHAGVLVDRRNRRTTMIVAEVVRFFAIGAVAVSAYLGTLELWHPIVAAIVAGSAFTVFDVADNPAFPRAVGAAQLPRAASLSEGGPTAAELVGPGAVGILLGLGVTELQGAAYTFGLDALTFSSERSSFWAPGDHCKRCACPATCTNPCGRR